MRKTLHIHFYTRDGPKFEESKHPRAENGQFGSGGAGKVSVKADVHGPYSSIEELRGKALEDAKRFAGKPFTNKATGHKIIASMSGIKHTLSRSGPSLAKSVSAIPDLLEHSTLHGSEPDKNKDPNILRVETYTAPLEVDGRTHTAVMRVKVYLDGRRYYDHGLVT